jgi:hypothetical protein
MENSMRQREASGVNNMDYLEYLLQLKKKREITGEKFELNLWFEKLIFGFF